MCCGVCVLVPFLETTESCEILDLAREQRMSTDVRKNIFCLIMTSEVSAYTDTHK